MSPRFIRIIVTLLVVACLFAAVYILVPKVGSGHPHMNTAGKIVYVCDNDSAGVPHVWLAAADGSGARDLTPGTQSCADPVFSPDGSEIAYVSDKDGSQQVYTMTADGRQVQAVTFGTAAKEQPSFSPDGKTLAFLSHGTVTALDLESKDTDPLLPAPASATATATSALVDVSHAPVTKYYWSPRPGATVSQSPAIAAVQESDDGDLQVLTLLPTVDGSAKELVAAQNVSLTWSPDGSSIYCALLGANLNPQQQNFSGIVRIAGDGTPLPNLPLGLTGSATVGPAYPTVSPDGKFVVFELMSEPDLAHQQVFGLYIQPADGSAAARQIVKGPVEYPQFSPDGSHLLMLVPGSKLGQRNVLIVALTGSASPVNLTNRAGNAVSASWSPQLPKAALN